MSDFCDDFVLEYVHMTTVSILAVTSISIFASLTIWWARSAAGRATRIASQVNHLADSEPGNQSFDEPTELSEQELNSIEPCDVKTNESRAKSVQDRICPGCEITGTEINYVACPVLKDEQINGQAESDLFADECFRRQVVRAVYRKALQETQVDPGTSCLAALVSVQNCSSSAQVLCLTAITNSASTLHSMPVLPRISLNDCRPQVLVRRAFLVFLYNELAKMVNNNGHSDFIECRPDFQGFRMKPNNHLVLVLSPSLEQEDESLRQEVIKRVTANNSAKKDCELFTSSTNPTQMDITGLEWCSLDKIAIWASVGLQGAILSHLMEPIFLESVIVVSSQPCFEVLKNSSSSWQQLGSCDGVEMVLPTFHRLQPLLGHREYETSSLSTNRTKGPSRTLRPLPDRPSCINWIISEGKPETIFADTGSVAHGKASRLCKAGLFDRFAGLFFGRTFPTLPWSKLRPVYPLNYATVKAQATPYQSSKQLLRSQLWPLRGHRPELFTSFRHSCPLLRDNFNAFEPK
ncbi:Double-stranded RNA-specific editase B2 [Halotydeus destructor]|nr:Double-stranded RNA-specific editase B2 [Halotydeus destructor]